MTELTSIAPSNGTLATSTNKTYVCDSLFTERLYLDTTQTHILVALLTLTMVVAWVTNSAVLYGIVNLNLLHNPSMLLIMFLSLSDLCIGVTGLPLYIATLVSEHDCKFDWAAEFFFWGFGHSSAYIIGLIGYDRYFRMKYLSGYSAVMKTWKVYIATIIVFILSFMHSSAHVIGMQFGVYRTIFDVSVGIDVVLLLYVLIPYVLTIFVVKSHRQNAVNRELLRGVDHTVTSIATRIMIAICIIYLPYNITSMMRRFLPVDSMIKNSKNFHFLWVIGHILIGLNSSVNAIIFVSMNKRVRSKIFALCHRQEV